MLELVKSGVTPKNTHTQVAKSTLSWLLYTCYYSSSYMSMIFQSHSPICQILSEESQADLVAHFILPMACWGFLGVMGLLPKSFIFNKMFHCQPSSYWGTTILGNPHVDLCDLSRNIQNIFRIVMNCCL